MRINSSKIFFCLGTLLLLVCRTVQLLFMTESTTGFFKTEYSGYRFIFGIITALIFVLSFYFGNMKLAPVYTPIKISTPLSTVSIFTAFAFLISSGASSFGVFNLGNLIKLVMAIITSSFFLVLGLSGLLKTSVPKAVSVLSLPYFVYNLVLCFVLNSGMAVISESAYEILMLSAVLLFFLHLAKLVCGVTAAKNSNFLIPIGFISAMLCFITTIPRYFIILIGEKGVLKANSYNDFSVFVIGIFITVFCFSAMNYTRKNRRRNRMFKPETSGGFATDSTDREFIIPEDE